MNVLFITLINIEDLDEQGIYTDLIREFRDKGNNVYVIQPLERRLNQNTKYMSHKGVNILKVKIGNITKTNIIEKGLTTISLERKLLKISKKIFEKIRFDLLLYSTPPITFTKVVEYYKKRDNVLTYLLLKDIFPQNAVDLGFMSYKNIVYKFFRNKEIQLYEVSDFIGCMSTMNVKYLCEHNYGLENKVEICPNSITPLPLTNNKNDIFRIRNKFNVPHHKIVLIYGGNLGRPQGIEFVKKCIRENENNNDFFILIIGNGTEFKNLSSFIEECDCKNTMLLPYINKNDYEKLVTACDVGLIFLDYRFTIPNFPSRILSYMQAALPIFALTDRSSDIGLLISNNNFGTWCPSNSVECFVKKLKIFKNENNRILMGNKSLEYLRKNYTSEITYKIITNHLK